LPDRVNYAKGLFEFVIYFNPNSLGCQYHFSSLKDEFTGPKNEEIRD